MKEYNRKKEEQSTPDKCEFCKIGGNIIESEYFYLVGNRSPYDVRKAEKKRSSHMMIISKSHIISKTEFTKKKLKDFLELFSFVESCYEEYYGMCCNFGRNLTDGQSMLHFHHHFIKNDNWMGSGIPPRPFYDYEVLDQDFKKLIRERW